MLLGVNSQSAWYVVLEILSTVVGTQCLCECCQMLSVRSAIDIHAFLIQSSELLYELEVAGPPMCVALNGSDGGIIISATK